MHRSSSANRLVDAVAELRLSLVSDAIASREESSRGASLRRDVHHIAFADTSCRRSQVLKKVLGHILLGIDEESLQLSVRSARRNPPCHAEPNRLTTARGAQVWNGDLRLSDLRLSADALNLLLASAPFRVLGGYIGQISLKASWRSLAGSGIRVALDRIYLVLSTKEVGELTEARAEQAAKATQVLSLCIVPTELPVVAHGR